jgi:hypothetical protein
MIAGMRHAAQPADAIPSRNEGESSEARMASKFVNLADAAVQLGISPEQLNDLRQQQLVYGYRDGSSWKFKPEDVDRLRESLAAGTIHIGGDGGEMPLASDSGSPADSSFELTVDEPPLDVGDSGDDVVLLSELELGESGAGTSSTVIGKPGQPLSEDDSDVKLTSHAEDSTIARGGSGIGGSGIDLVQEKREAGGSSIGGGSDIRLADDDVKSPASGGSSAIQLGDDQSDDEFVLDSPGLGSDITRSPGDSGISLLDPSDSGLSLDVPINLGAPPAAGESEFELSGSSGEALGAATEFDSDEVMEVKSGDDFLLTPLGSEAEEESEDSGSQVIALDSEASFEDTDASMFGSESESMSAMLEEDVGAAAVPLDTIGLGAAAAPALVTAGAQMVPAGREAAYPLWINMTLVGCFLMLFLSGMMMYDLVRNMWSWDQPYSVNSSIMDTVLSWFGS